MPTFNPKELRNLLKQDFWTKPELEWILLGLHHPSLQNAVTDPDTPGIEVKSDFQTKTEKMLTEIFTYIDDTESIGKLRKSKQKIERRLFLNNPPLALSINHWGYETIDLLILLQEKEYPIRKELIQAIKDNDWDTAVSKILNLPKDMMEVIGSDFVFAQATNVIPAPQGTRREDVTISLISNDTIKISIKGQTGRFHFSKMGFSDGRKGDKPTVLWILLMTLIKEQGELSSEGGEFQQQLISNASRLNTHMKNIFCIEQNIFPHYKIQKCYKAAFQVSDKTYGTAEDLRNNL